MSEYVLENPAETGELERKPSEREVVDMHSSKVISVYESTHPEMVEEIWRMHAQTYFNEGFVDGGLTKEGYLVPELDKARGPNVEYVLFQDSENPRKKASIRKVHSMEGGYRDLPIVKFGGENISLQGHDFLNMQIENGNTIVEMAALCRSEGRDSVGLLHEVVRGALHDSIRRGNEVWVMSFVETSYRHFRKHFSQNNFTPLGESFKIDDERVNDDVTLMPLAIEPNEFLDRLLGASIDAEDEKERRFLQKRLSFYADGLKPKYMSSSVRKVLHGTE